MTYCPPPLSRRTGFSWPLLGSFSLFIALVICILTLLHAVVSGDPGLYVEVGQ